MCLIIVMQNKVFINCGRSSMFSQALSLNNTILRIEQKKYFYVDKQRWKLLEKHKRWGGTTQFTYVTF